MKFKGTKGGWKYYHELGDNKIISVNHQFIISNLTGTGLFVTSPNTNPHHKEANALLISKAPEMLEMLEKLVKTYELLGLSNEVKQLIKEATEL